ncbi:MAG: hypothetical protein KJ607_12940 [Bacteroidetes bacterium]|nr:hypothetical protein [Bacteroidota bacterium]
MASSTITTACLIISIALLNSCSERRPQKEEKKPGLIMTINRQKQTDTSLFEDFTAGSILDTVRIKDDLSLSYALYLPSGYSKERKWPVLFLLDSHARGRLAAETFRETAEKYGYILICSNNSKNGLSLETSMQITESMINDAKKRLPVDGNRLSIGGFSGGSRAASNYALNTGDIAAVIGCGAGFPRITENLIIQFDYMGIAGREDCNLPEMMKLDTLLQGGKIRHILSVFDGGHEWPSGEVIEDALLWLETTSMKRNTIPKDDSLTTYIARRFERRIAFAKQKSRTNEADRMYTTLISYLDGLKDVSSYRKEQAKLRISETYTKDREGFRILLDHELSEQQRFFQSFFSKKPGWWQTEVGIIRKNSEKAGTPDEKASAKRLLGYMSLLAYTHAENAITSGQQGQAQRLLEIYRLVDPDNPDCYYLWAMHHTTAGRKSQAVASLKKAVELRFTDFDKIRQNHLLDPLKDDQEFIKILQQ